MTITITFSVAFSNDFYSCFACARTMPTTHSGNLYAYPISQTQALFSTADINIYYGQYLALGY